MLTITKCKSVTIKNSTFKSNNKANIIYNEMDAKYTKNVTFSNNKYSNGGSNNSKYFRWHNKEYNFNEWKRKCSDTKSVFT